MSDETRPDTETPDPGPASAGNGQPDPASEPPAQDTDHNPDAQAGDLTDSDADVVLDTAEDEDGGDETADEPEDVPADTTEEPGA